MPTMLWPRGSPKLCRLGPMSELHPKTLWDQAYNRGGVKLQKAVLNTLRTWANPQTLECFATLEDLAEQTGLSVSACWRQIKANEAAGWIEIVHEGHSGGKANDYRLLNPGVNAKVPGHQGEQNPSVNAMNPSVNAKETLALTHNQLGIKEIQRGSPKEISNPSENARDDQDLHSAQNSPRVGPTEDQGDPWGSPILPSGHTEPRRGEVQGDSNPSVNAKVSTAGTPGSPEPQDHQEFPDPFADTPVLLPTQPEVDVMLPFVEVPDSGDPKDPFSLAYEPPTKLTTE